MLGTLQCSDFAGETFCNKVQERPWVAIMGRGAGDQIHTCGGLQNPLVHLCAGPVGSRLQLPSCLASPSRSPHTLSRLSTWGADHRLLGSPSGSGFRRTHSSLEQP